jgi:Rrf2 family protein
MAKIINISEAASLAIHSMAMIAKSESMLNVNQIAQRTKSSKNHLAKVMQVLVRNNYLASVRGPSGGFTLNVDPDQVSLLQIYELFDGKLQGHHCGIEEGKCPFESCLYGSLIDKFSTEFSSYLRNKKLSDFILTPVLQ